MTDEALKQMTRDQAIKELVTPEGKQLAIYHVKNTSLYKVAFQTGGQLPEKLDGMYTDTTRAYEAAQKYVKSRWDDEQQKEERAAEREEKGHKQPGRPRKDQQATA